MLALFDDQQVTLHLQSGLDAQGNPASFAGVPIWSSSPTGLVDLTPSPDGTSCIVVAIKTLGRVTVNATAPGNLSGQPNPLTDSIEIEITADAAKSLNITADQPVLQDKFNAAPAPPVSVPDQPAPASS
jgi:hypothetical protein